ncbi:diaminopimelate epimerase [Nocardioides terrae]|uniref:Diaminopimelate epimerase n=1 Tax=Nocardioides terrae TaxID=574651 RepID=A0A1I1I379_9ACTN|nr:diaminopimelate epimerase [Nocardioides terrae]SFC30636.1 diaminopimelate epimerase [Nocardioides terrae]
MTYPFLKGHGTENDFVLLPDPDGTAHGDLAPDRMAARVQALCDRHAGIGGDGVLRLVRTSAVDPAETGGSDAEWFMDYRNADGSVAEMCGNGTRVFVQYLRESGRDTGDRITIATRAGDKTLTFDGADWTVDLGEATLLGETEVGVGHYTWPAQHVSMGNPHAIAFVDSLDPHGPVGSLLEAPDHDAAVYPEGVNVEFVARVGERHVAMRVHERGVGETRSCGTGAGAVGVAAMIGDGAIAPATYVVDVPGGRLRVTWTTAGRVLLTGPALIVAAGETDL